MLLEAKLIFIWDQLPVHDFIKGMEQKWKSILRNG
jgi:hypothetical protein